jgi:hypothetical protein
MKLTGRQIDKYIDEMNELEALSDRHKLRKDQYKRYWDLHRIVYLNKGCVKG